MSISALDAADAHHMETETRELLCAARHAQAKVAHWPQERVDCLVSAVGWHFMQGDTARDLVCAAVRESGIGDPDDSLKRLNVRVVGVLNDLHGQTTLGPVDETPQPGIKRFAKPVGVIGALLPSTAPVATLIIHVLTALKTRNALIVCPNPSVQQSISDASALIRRVLHSVGAPMDLVQAVGRPSRDSAADVCAGTDLVVATGGAKTVRRARLSGTPIYPAGPGNAVIIIDETADVETAIATVVGGRAFDNGTSCSSESCALIAENVWARAYSALEANNAHVCSEADVERLRQTLWHNGRLSRDLVGRPAAKIAERCQIEVEPGTRLLAARLAGAPFEDRLSGEKLAPVLATIPFGSFDEAVALTRQLTARFGPGHSCGIFTNHPDRPTELARSVNVGRVMVNQSTGHGNTGSFTNAMPFSAAVSCGTWGGCTTTENVNWRHLLNYTWVSMPHERPRVSPAELLAPYTATHWFNSDQSEPSASL